MADEVVVVLEGERPVSNNQFYAGMHWAKRKALADSWHLLVRAALPENISPPSPPLAVEITAYFKGQMQDADNICSKLIIDGLVRGGVVPDDTPQYIEAVTLRSRQDRKRPRIEIRLKAA